MAERKEDNFSISENSDDLTNNQTKNSENCLNPHLLKKQINKNKKNPKKTKNLEIIQISEQNLRKITKKPKKEEILQDLLDRPNCEFDLSGTPLLKNNTKILLNDVKDEIFVEEMKDGTKRFVIGGKIVFLEFSHCFEADDYDAFVVDRKNQGFGFLGTCEDYFVVPKIN